MRINWSDLEDVSIKETVYLLSVNVNQIKSRVKKTGNKNPISKLSSMM